VSDSKSTENHAEKENKPFVLMHISDLHLHTLPRNPFRYFSKRALGGINLLLFRGRSYPLSQALRLVETLSQESWDHLLITGDLTQLSFPEEFDLVKMVLGPVLKRGGDRVTVMPGNHDRYVPEAPGKSAFEVAFGPFSTNRGLVTRQLTAHWWLACWDSVQPAGWFSASGKVLPETLEATDEWIATLPAGAKVIIANHYPVYFPPPFHYMPSHDLINPSPVKQWLESRPVTLYLHGHIHHNWITTIPRTNGNTAGPLTVVNSASSTELPKPLRRSAYHRIELLGPEFRVIPQPHPKAPG